MICGVFLAAALLRFLDPYTSVYQTDDPAEGQRLSAEVGYWPVPQGLVDPLAKDLKPRVVHAVFRVQETPFADYDPSKPSPLFKVNQVGYLPHAPKFAYVGAWLGPKLGAWKPRRGTNVKCKMENVKLGNAWEIVEEKTGKVVYGSPERPVLRVVDGQTKEGVPFTGNYEARSGAESTEEKRCGPRNAREGIIK